MQLAMYQVDAFTRSSAHAFSGNPAAVVPLPRWINDAAMQAIAAENNLSETAFFVNEDDVWHIRWFTPTTEVDLCGHATLAAARIIVDELGDDRAVLPFHCGIGPLSVARDAQQPQRLWLDFPQRAPQTIDNPLLLSKLEKALGQQVKSLSAARDLVVELNDQQAVANCAPDFHALAGFEYFAVTITAAASTQGYDFVSRFFAPRQGLNEDPVTGSSFCSLAPYWAHRLDKQALRAWQCSTRGGDVDLELTDARVRIGGESFIYLRGDIWLPAGQ